MKYHFQDLMQFKPETFWLHQKYWNANWFLNYIQMSLSSSHLYWIGRLNMSKLRRLTVTQYPYSTCLHFIQETNKDWAFGLHFIQETNKDWAFGLHFIQETNKDWAFGLHFIQETNKDWALVYTSFRKLTKTEHLVYTSFRKLTKTEHWSTLHSGN